MSLVGVVLLRIIHAWQFTKGEDQELGKAYQSAMESNIRDMVNLSLDPCWSKSSRLRDIKIDLLAAFANNEAWRDFLSSRPQEASAATISITTATVDLLCHPQTSPKGACVLLATISRILRTSGFLRSESAAHGGRLTPYLERKSTDSNTPAPERCRCVELTTKAYPLVLSRLHDNVECVRLCALEVLGDFLPLVPPDEAHNQGQILEASQGDQESTSDRVDAVVSISNTDNTISMARSAHSGERIWYIFSFYATQSVSYMQH